jgi:hypothetical protein
MRPDTQIGPHTGVKIAGPADATASTEMDADGHPDPEAST